MFHPVTRFTENPPATTTIDTSNGILASVSHGSYTGESCNDNRDSNNPTIVGEWSLALPDNVQSTSDWNPSSNMDFYKKWFAAQLHSY
jgi:hypothetical protein